MKKNKQATKRTKRDDGIARLLRHPEFKRQIENEFNPLWGGE